MAIAGGKEYEVWDLPPEGTERRERVLKLLALLLRSHHPHVRAPDSLAIQQPQRSEGASLRLTFPRMLSCVSLRDATVRGMLVSSDPSTDGRRRVAHQLTSTMAFLHRHGVYHNFLTSDEILVETNSEACDTVAAGAQVPTTSCTPSWRILLTQFYQSSVTPVSSASYMCSRNYRPPEVVLGYQADSRSVDLWLLGCLMVEVATGKPAFSLVSSRENGVMKPMLLRQQLEQIVSCVGPVAADEIPDEFNARHKSAILSMPGSWKMLEMLQEAGVDQPQLWDEVLRACLAFHPSKRMDAEQLLQLPLFQQGLAPQATGASDGALVFSQFQSIEEAIEQPL